MNLADMKAHIWRYLNFNMDLPNSLIGHHWEVLGLDRELTELGHERYDRALTEIADEMWNKHRRI